MPSSGPRVHCTSPPALVSFISSPFSIFYHNLIIALAALWIPLPRTPSLRRPGVSPGYPSLHPIHVRRSTSDDSNQTDQPPPLFSYHQSSPTQHDAYHKSCQRGRITTVSLVYLRSGKVACLRR